MRGKPARYLCRAANVKLLRALALQDVNVRHWGVLVDLIGIEPMTSSMPWKRAPSCATGPRLEVCNSPIVSAEARFVNLAWASSGWRAFCIDRREVRVLAVDWGWQNRRQCEAEVAICRLP